MPEQFERMIDLEYSSRYEKWRLEAGEYIGHNKGRLSLAVPSILQSTLNYHLRELVNKVSNDRPRTGNHSTDQAAYSRLMEKVLYLDSYCRIRWASHVLSVETELTSVLKLIAASMLSYPPDSNTERISESEVINRLYMLEVGLSANEISGGAYDWHEVKRAYQTEERKLSSAYVLCLRGLWADGIIRGHMRDDAVTYVHDPLLQNWSVTELTRLRGRKWVEDFLITATRAVLGRYEGSEIEQRATIHPPDGRSLQ